MMIRMVIGTYRVQDDGTHAVVMLSLLFVVDGGDHEFLAACTGVVLDDQRVGLCGFMMMSTVIRIML